LRLAILGATGKTGTHLVRQALRAGHSVAALARDPAKVAVQDAGLRVVRGDATEAACVEDVVAGAEAVLSVLSPSVEAVENILQAMEKHGVRRLIVATGAGVAQPGDTPPFLDRAIGFLIKTLSREVYERAAQQAERLRASGVDWTLARAPVLTDRPGGAYQVTPVSSAMNRTLSREAFARFFLDAIEDRATYRQAPVVSDRR
jgi:putative NADH-flavin reductase